jgi:hypothetical protein
LAQISIIDWKFFKWGKPTKYGREKSNINTPSTQGNGGDAESKRVRERTR